MREFQPAHTGGQINGTSHINPGSQFRPSTMSTTPYVPRAGREKMCIAKNDTCKGYKMAGSDYCSGHTRSKAKGRVAE